MEAIEINRVIEDFAKNIAEEVATKRFYEIDEVKAIATTRLSLALTEILQMQVLEQEDKRAQLTAVFTDPKTPKWKRQKVMGELATLNAEIKKVNKAVAARKDFNEYQRLRYFVQHRYGYDVLTEFYNELRTPAPKPKE